MNIIIMHDYVCRDGYSITAIIIHVSIALYSECLVLTVQIIIFTATAGSRVMVTPLPAVYTNARVSYSLLCFHDSVYMQVVGTHDA